MGKGDEEEGDGQLAPRQGRGQRATTHLINDSLLKDLQDLLGVRTSGRSGSLLMLRRRGSSVASVLRPSSVVTLAALGSAVLLLRRLAILACREETSIAASTARA